MNSVRPPRAPRAAFPQELSARRLPDPPSVEPFDPFRPLAFRFGLVLLFVRVTMLHQVLTRLVGVNLYLLYVISIPALIGVVAGGGIRRTLQGKLSRYWILYAVWLVLAIPTSTWPGGSLSRVFTYFRTELLLLFVVGGLAVTWKECRAILWSLAMGAAVCLVNARLFHLEDANERVALQFGTIANANDFACHLMTFLPFLLWVAMAGRPAVLRPPALVLLLIGILVTLRTASRGALVAVVVSFIYFLWRATGPQRAAAVLTVPLALAGLFVFVPDKALDRLSSIGPAEAGDQEAAQSRAARQDLLEESIRYTLRYPLFGVGPAMFAVYEGQNRKVIGDHGRWQETHNTYTQISSECGLPALALYLAAIAGSLRLLHRLHREARARPGCRDIQAAVFCIGLSIVAYSAASAFLSFAYFFYMPALTGLSMVADRAARREFVERAVAAGAPARVAA